MRTISILQILIEGRSRGWFVHRKSTVYKQNENLDNVKIGHPTELYYYYGYSV